jgi:putative photosynthetic complex assembly protein
VSDTIHADSVPKGALWAAATLVAFALLAATTARLLHMNATPMPHAQAVTVLQLVFRDRNDGAVEVLDATHDGALMRVLPPGSNGFVRGVLRSLARARRSAGVGHDAAFLLTRWNDGRMTLDDPSTGQHVNLEVFGPANALPFAEMFGAPELSASRSTPAAARN